MEDPTVTVADATALPTGTATFLFTDIEGSTRLLQQLGDRFAELLDRHHALIRDAIRAHGGHEIHVTVTRSSPCSRG